MSVPDNVLTEEELRMLLGDGTESQPHHLRTKTEAREEEIAQLHRKIERLERGQQRLQQRLDSLEAQLSVWQSAAVLAGGASRSYAAATEEAAVPVPLPKKASEASTLRASSASSGVSRNVQVGEPKLSRLETYGRLHKSPFRFWKRG